ncbi:MAG TPA: hypothetical protein VGK48_21300 [Terriglobia bacterium]|jgi:hypothetical protein
MVTGDSVEKACAEVGEYTDEFMVSEFDRFFRAQPSICEFIIELTSGSGQKIQELSLFLSYIVFKAAEIEKQGAADTISQEQIEAAYRTTESWMAQLGGSENSENQAAIAASMKQDKEPNLLQYVISELNEPLEDDVELNEEEKGEIFFILKTVIASLDRGVERRIIEIDQ